MKKVYLIICLLILLFCTSCINTSQEDEISIDVMYQNISEKTYEEFAKIYGDFEIKLYTKDELDYNTYQYIRSFSPGPFVKCIVLVSKVDFRIYPVVLELYGSLPENLFENTKEILGISNYSIKGNVVYYTCSGSYTMFEEYEEHDNIGYYKNAEYLVCANDTEIINVFDETIKIAPYACFASEKLKELKCGSSLKYIYKSAFEDCTSLENVYLNAGLIEIHENAFFNAVNLKYVVIPSSVTTIRSNAFNKGKIFLEGQVQEGYAKDFASGEATVYYKGQWEYNSEGIPTPR